ncbi:hypothetical protein [Xanthobacter autotrophicus]|uniref:hypothetical protein n=1 Tax=Xanthobacter autotrophicus TaxID=280 RepID=UPI00372946B3
MTRDKVTGDMPARWARALAVNRCRFRARSILPMLNMAWRRKTAGSNSRILTSPAESSPATSEFPLIRLPFDHQIPFEKATV